MPIAPKRDGHTSTWPKQTGLRGPDALKPSSQTAAETPSSTKNRRYSSHAGDAPVTVVVTAPLSDMSGQAFAAGNASARDSGSQNTLKPLGHADAQIGCKCRRGQPAI